ncbi:MAG TPA: cupin domain-containing protein [Chitinispirillaceae bacterium]|nr:cupin domain-containing protein [Chitinispirillaceae bacterium]
MTFFHSFDDYDWESIPVLSYKEEGTHFKNITRRVLFDGTSGIDAELRYFEISPGGYSTLESHKHVHQVLILRGTGRALIGNKIFDLKPHDCFEIGPNRWHQFQASPKGPFGFLCLVKNERDRPHRPDKKELEELHSDILISKFIRT